MDYHRDKEKELQAREAEVRLRELELEINQQQADIPLYQTTKQKKPNSVKVFSNKIVRVGKFLAFSIVTLALMRVAMILGMWLARGFLAAVVVFIAYQLFLREDD